MAERRMFAKSIVETDKFMSMSLEAQILYFRIGLDAYDKGIVINAATLSRCIDDTTGPLEELIDNEYVYPLEDGTYQITHWYENNGIGETAKKRNSYSYRKWREQVIERDKKCAICNSTDKLVAHHIKPFAEYPTLRFDINNGITLCESCHMKLHGLVKKDGEEENV